MFAWICLKEDPWPESKHRVKTVSFAVVEEQGPGYNPWSSLECPTMGVAVVAGKTRQAGWQHHKLVLNLTIGVGVSERLRARAGRWRLELSSFTFSFDAYCPLRLTR